MKTLEDLFGPMLDGEDEVNATLTLHKDGLVFDCHTHDGDIGVVTLPLGLCVQMDPVARKATSAEQELSHLKYLVNEASYILEGSDNSDPIALLDYINELSSSPTSAHPMPMLIDGEPIDLVGRMEGLNDMNKDMLHDGCLPEPLSDIKYHEELLENAEELEPKLAHALAVAQSVFYPIWVAAKGVPTLRKIGGGLVITDGSKVTRIAYNEDHLWAYTGILQGIIKLYPNIVVI